MRGDRRLRVPNARGDGHGALNQIGERLENQLRAKKLRHAKLIARIEDVTGGRWRPTRQDIYKITNGTRSVSEIELLALAEAIGCDPVWLFVGEASAAEKAKELAQVWRATPIPATQQGISPEEHNTESET